MFTKEKPLILSRADIDGDNPVRTAYRVVWDHAETQKQNEFAECIHGLPHHWRAVFTTQLLEMGVNNGGHHQFFWNSDGEFNQDTLEDLRLISAQPFVTLYKQALEVFSEHDYRGDKRKSGNTWEAFTEAYKANRMDDLDNAFYKAAEPLREYMNDFIRTNRDKYIGDA